MVLAMPKKKKQHQVALKSAKGYVPPAAAESIPSLAILHSKFKGRDCYAYRYRSVLWDMDKINK
jgi:hypothetical protein